MNKYKLEDIISNYKDYGTGINEFIKCNDHIYDVIKDNLKICVTNLRQKIVEHNNLIDMIQFSNLYDQNNLVLITMQHNKSPWVLGILERILDDVDMVKYESFKVVSLLHILYTFCKKPKKTYPFDNPIRIKIQVNTINLSKKLSNVKLITNNQNEMLTTFLNLMNYRGQCSLLNRHDLRCWMMSILINDVISR